MEDNTSTVALRTQEAGKAVQASQLQLRDALRDLADRPRPDLEPDLAGLAVLRDLRFVLQAEIEGRQPGGGVSQRASLHQLRRQNQSVHSAIAAQRAHGGCRSAQASWRSGRSWGARS